METLKNGTTPLPIWLRSFPLITHAERAGTAIRQWAGTAIRRGAPGDVTAE
jgi:hypothetical protein